MITFASRAAAPIVNGVCRLLLAFALAGATAATSRADDAAYVAGPTASSAWTTGELARTPLAGPATPRNLLAGGEDQYVAGPTALQAWPKPDGRTPLAGDAAGPTGWSFDLARQGG